MPTFTPEKTLRDLPKTPVILNVILQGVDQQRAQTSTDGPDGWSVLEVLSHMNDFEQIFLDRVMKMVETDLPRFEAIDPDALAKNSDYAGQNLSEVFASYVSRRRAHLAFLRGLTPEQWQRTGVHYASGEQTVVELATNTTLHDVNHIEQIIKALGSSPTLATL